MSTENVALFLQTLSEDADLCGRLVDGAVSPASYVQVAADVGYDFSEDDIHQFACQLLGNPALAPETSIRALLETYVDVDEEELTEEGLQGVAGGRTRRFRGPFQFTSSLFKRIKALGYPSLSGQERIRTVIVKDFLK